MNARQHAALECDHLRPIVVIDGEIRHADKGIAGSPCSAGVYRVYAIYDDEHYLSNLMLEST